jgi:hypothetical protein
VTTNDDLLAKLPRAARDAFDRALAAPRDDHKERNAQTAIAWNAVDIPKGEFFFPVHELPTSFNEVQRAALELSARNELGAFPYACPGVPKTLRTWLGLEPGVLETRLVDGEPLWRALQKARGVAILDTLPCDVALRALGELCTTGYGYRIDPTQLLPSGACGRLLRDLKDEGRAWALAQADAMKDVPGYGSALRAFVFLALVRAGVPIEPRWDWFYPNLWGAPKELLFECARAIPEDRRAAVLGPRLQSMHWAMEMFAEFPSAAMARALLDSLEANSPRWAYFVEQLRAFGEKHPAVAAAVESAVAAAPKPIELRVTRVAKPTRAEELTPLEREQLRIGVRDLLRGMEGEDPDAEPSLAEFIPGCWILNIASASGEPLYDALLYAADNGVIFRAGTTEDVGWCVQGGFDLKERDDALRNALHIACGRAMNRGVDAPGG